MFTRVGLLRLGLLITIVTQNPAFAASSPLSQGFTYQGRLFTADGSESMTGLMDLTLGIYSANGNCLLYEERQNNFDLTESQGFFSVVVGSALGDPKRVTPDRDPGKTLSEIFANGKLLRADEATCPGGYTPANGEGRVLKVTMHPHGGVTETLTPDLVISPNPQTFVAETLQGANGWYTDWTSTRSGSVTANCKGAGGGAGGGAYDYDGDDGGTGGFSGIAATATPTIYLITASGGNAGIGATAWGFDNPGGDGGKGYQFESSIPITAGTTYRIYVGRGGDIGAFEGDGSAPGTSYTQHSSETATGTANLGAAGGVGGYGTSTPGSNGSVTISW